jgi:hypothetical protein
MGPENVDYIEELRRRGLRRTLDFDYAECCKRFGHPESDIPDEEVTSDNCDSLFLGRLIDVDMRCPKCGEYAFAEDD